MIGEKLAYLEDMEDEDDYVLLGANPGAKPSTTRAYKKTKILKGKNFQEDFMARRGYSIQLFLKS